MPKSDRIVPGVSRIVLRLASGPRPVIDPAEVFYVDASGADTLVRPIR